MKKFTINLLALGILFLGLVINGSAQYQPATQRAKVIAPLPGSKFVPKSESMIGTKPMPPLPSNKQLMDDPILATTRYDLQTNVSDQNRIYLHPDGTIGATAIWSTQDASWTDRGTGYNYFDGTSWGPQPTVRIENEKAGWPSYAPFGATGEIVVTHANTAGLIIAKRPVKGTGSWTTSILPGPPGAVDISWPRMVTNGPNHNYIHILAVTYQTYQGMTNQLLYYRSLDGGVTWDKDNYIIPGTTSSQYTNFGADIYSWADPHGDTLAFTVGDSWQDQFLMKSTDNGTTWTKTIIYNSPYNLGGNSPGWFYCPDGTSAISLDNQGMAHVVFGLSQDSGSPTAGYYNIIAEGIAYWNENMPQLNQSLDPNILNANHQYVAWVKDANVFTLPVTQLSYWFTSLTSNPQLVIDKANKVFLVWAGATSLVDPNNFNLRHIYGRDGVISGDTVMWHNDTLIDLTGDWIQYNFAECMFPSTSPTSDAYVYILFQTDDYGGSYVKSINATGTWQGQTSPDDNFMTVIRWEKPIWTGVNEKHEKPTFSVGQNFPNPVDGVTRVNVYLQNGGGLSLKVTNLTGQVLMSMEKTNVLPGVSQFVIDGNKLAPGVYFYSVKQGDVQVTKKMIIQ
jgi:Secretion system C-terminal sorting domain